MTTSAAPAAASRPLPGFNPRTAAAQHFGAAADSLGRASEMFTKGTGGANPNDLFGRAYVDLSQGLPTLASVAGADAPLVTALQQAAKGAEGFAELDFRAAFIDVPAFQKTVSGWAQDARSAQALLTTEPA